MVIFYNFNLFTNMFIFPVFIDLYVARRVRNRLNRETYNQFRTKPDLYTFFFLQSKSLYNTRCTLREMYTRVRYLSDAFSISVGSKIIIIIENEWLVETNVR